MYNIYLAGFNLDDLLEKIGQVVDAKLSKVSIPKSQENQCVYLSRHEVAKLLKISLVTLNDWSKLGWLQSYKIGNRVLYKQEEVEQALHKVQNQKYRKGAL